MVMLDYNDECDINKVMMVLKALFTKLQSICNKCLTHVS